MKLNRLTNAVVLTSAFLLLTSPGHGQAIVNANINDPKVKVNSDGSHSLPVRLVDTTGAYVAAGGGGGGGAMTVADGADVVEGTLTDAVSSAGGTGSVSSKLRRLTTDLDAVKTSVAGAQPAGTNIIGKVGIDQTTPGTTNLVAANNTQVNGVAMLAGNGVTGTGSQRVTIASDNTAFSVNANAGTNLNTSALALDATLTKLNITQGTALGSNTGPMAQGSVTTAAPSYTTGQISPMSLNTAGGLRTDVAQVGGTNIATNNGASSAGTLRVTLASDSPPFTTLGSAVTTKGIYDTGIATTANPTNATAGNAVGMQMDKAGRVVATQVAIRELVAIQQTNIATTSETTFITAAGASVFADLTDLIITTAGAAAQTITIKDVTAGTTRMVLNYPNAAVAPGQPLILHFSPPIPQATANSAWTITNSAATAINVTAVYVKNL